VLVYIIIYKGTIKPSSQYPPSSNTNYNLDNPNPIFTTLDNPNPIFTTELNTPGKYTVYTSAPIFVYDENMVQLGGGLLWSKPLQITVLAEKIPEYPFAVPVLIISFVSLLIFYRIKFKF
jgi:hypothetical protein